MTAVIAVLLLVMLICVVAVVYVVARGRAQVSQVSAPADVVSGLMTALRKAEAETAYWRSAAERLQREADDR